MTHSAGLDLAHRAIFLCRMNQDIHSEKKGRYGFWDRALRIGVGFLAVLSLTLSVISCFQGVWSVWSWLSAGFSGLSAIAAITLNVVPAGDWEKHHLDLFRRWTSLRRRWENLQLRMESCDPNTDVDRYQRDELEELSAEKHYIEADEPTVDDAVREKHYKRLCAIYAAEKAQEAESPPAVAPTT